MASRLDFSQIRSLYIGTSSSTTVDTNNLIVDGSVGIGTTSPSSRLEISGTTGSYNSGIGFVPYGTGARNYRTFIATDGSFNFDDATAGATRINLSSAGNVGIGTTSPGSMLQVGGSGAVASATPTAIQLDNSYRNAVGGNTSLKFYLYKNGNETYGIGLNNAAGMEFHVGLNASSASAYYAFYQEGLEKVRIAAGGDVGIGTTSPREKLQVTGNTVIGSAGLNSYKTNLYLTYSAGADETWFRIYVPQDYVSSNNGGTIKVRVLWEGDHATFGAYQEYQISYKTYYPASPYLTFSNVFCTNKTSDFNTGSTYYGPSSTPDVNFYTAGDSYLYVLVKGYQAAYNTARYIEAEIFGRTTAQPTIGTTTAPGSPSLIPKTIQFLPQEGNIYASGSVGIGTTSPTTPLRVQGGASMTGGWNKNTTLAATYPVLIFNSNDSKWAGIGYDYSEAFRIWVNASSDDVNTVSPQFNILNNGNVGIGTASPSDILHVYKSGANTRMIVGNNANYDQYIYFQGNNDWSIGIDASNSNAFTLSNYSTIGTNDRITVTTAGNVGIGNTAPASKLDVISSSTQIADFRSTVTDGLSNIRVVNDQQTTASGTSPAAIELIGKRGSSTHGRHAWIGAEGVDGTTFRTQIKFKVRPEDSPYQWSTLPTQMVIDGNGNVGIGTTSPDAKLVIVGSGTGVAKIGDAGFGSGNYTGISLNGTLSTSNYNILSSPTDSTLYINRPTGATIQFRENNTTQVIIAASGNVGIGTTSPNPYSWASRTLTVVSSGSNSYAALEAYGTGTGAGAVLLGNTSVLRASIVAEDGSNLLFATNTSNSGSSQVEKMRITAAGNIGVNTTTPYSGTNVTSVTINATAYPVLGFQVGGSRTAEVIGYFNHLALNTPGFIALSPGDAEAVRVTTAGNVGIGTTSPAGTLDIGKNNATPSLVIGNSTYGANYNSVWGLQSGAQSIMIFGNNGQNEIRAGNTGVGGYLDFYTNNTASFTTASNGNFVMRLSSGGNVGIGTTSPSFKLDVAGAASDWATRFYSNASASAYFAHGGGYGGYINAGSNASSSTYLLELISNGSTRVYVRGDGNVGIGTTSPSEKLHVDGNVIVTYNNSFQGINSIGNKAILARVSPTTGIINYAEYATATNLNGFVLGSDDARVKGDIATDSLDFITNTSSRMFINSSGNVGIGTTSPTLGLHVADGKGFIVGPSGASASVYVSPSDENTINGGYGIAADTADIWLNYRGYQDGFSYFRDTRIGNGKGTAIVMVDGSEATVGIGTTSPSYKLDVVGDVRITSGSLGVGIAPNATDGRIDASNDIVAYSTSDQRLKENVTPIENALEKVKTLTGVEFDWKEETAHVHGYHGHDVGIIAQDVQAVLPEAVRTNESGYLSVRYEKMIALLIEANKELAARVEELEKKLK